MAVPKKLDVGGAFGWCDAAVMMPWIMYRTYGDRRILETQYESMKGWVEYQYRRSEELTRLDWQGFGDWLAWEGDHRAHYSPGEPTDKDMLGTAYFYQSASVLARVIRAYCGICTTIIAINMLCKPDPSIDTTTSASSNTGNANSTSITRMMQKSHQPPL